MTEAAGQFITPVTMQALSGRPVYTSQWDSRSVGGVVTAWHTSICRVADAILRPAVPIFNSACMGVPTTCSVYLMCLARPWTGCRCCWLLTEPGSVRTSDST
jgi:phosphopantothenoylcysteine decarboxylase/phosphopantothenate--cysteine ligase